jgi:type I restriction-modification system DNA methylase subunit
MLEQIKNRIRNHSYMSQIERDEQRIQATAEYFTPTELVQKMLDSLPEELFSDSTKTFIDPACGDGQFLGEVLIKKLENGIALPVALSTLYGVDIMRDNVDLCKKRLGGGNIIMGNTLCPEEEFEEQTKEEKQLMKKWFTSNLTKPHNMV